MKGGSVTDSPSNVGVPRLCVGVPLLVCLVVLLNGGCGVCCGVPCLGWVRHLCIVSAPLALSVSSRIVLPSFFFFVWCRVCCGWGNAVGGWGGARCLIANGCILLFPLSFLVFVVTALLV